jgi:very-short-patch-repair endonuclease
VTFNFNRRRDRDKRKSLRSNASDAEKKLWQYLKAKQLGAKFRRQYSVDAYVLDFYSPLSKLAIEIDGDSHFTTEAMSYDAERTAYLNAFGIEVMRFTNLEIVENIEAVLEKIAAAVERKGKPQKSYLP